MDWNTYLKEQTNALGSLRKAEPEAAAGFGALHKAALREGAVSVKHKELTCIALGIAAHCLDCIGFHVKAAIRAGASREEVAETVAVAMAMGGGPSYMYGAKALEAFDQLSA